MQEAANVFSGDLYAHPCPQGVDAEKPQILIEVAAAWQQCDWLDSACLSACAQGFRSAITGRIVVADDIETAQRCREQDGGEMRSRERGDHRHGRHDTAERQHGLDALAGRHHVARKTEADAVAEEMTHCPSWRI